MILNKLLTPWVTPVVTGEGTGTPLQYSCLENPMDGGAGGLQSIGSRKVRHNWTTSLSCIGEGNGNPLQCSCLENPRDGGAWWAAVYGVAQSRTRLKWLSSSSNRKTVTVPTPLSAVRVRASTWRFRTMADVCEGLCTYQLALIRLTQLQAIFIFSSWFCKFPTSRGC